MSGRVGSLLLLQLSQLAPPSVLVPLGGIGIVLAVQQKTSRERRGASNKAGSSRGVKSGTADPFERFARDSGLSVTVEPISVAPRDVLVPPADADEYFLVTLAGPQPNSGLIRLVIVVPPREKMALAVHEPERVSGTRHDAKSTPPSVRDALWWLAADAWAIERAEGSMGRWAAMYDYPLGSAATARLFERQMRQTSALRDLLSRDRYRQLLDLYEAEVSASKQARK